MSSVVEYVYVPVCSSGRVDNPNDGPMHPFDVAKRKAGMIHGSNLYWPAVHDTIYGRYQMLSFQLDTEDQRWLEEVHLRPSSDCSTLISKEKGGYISGNSYFPVVSESEVARLCPKIDGAPPIWKVLISDSHKEEFFEFGTEKGKNLYECYKAAQKEHSILMKQHFSKGGEKKKKVRFRRSAGPSVILSAAEQKKKDEWAKVAYKLGWLSLELRDHYQSISNKDDRKNYLLHCMKPRRPEAVKSGEQLYWRPWECTGFHYSVPVYDVDYPDWLDSDNEHTRLLLTATDFFALFDAREYKSIIPKMKRDELEKNGEQFVPFCNKEEVPSSLWYENLKPSSHELKDKHPFQS